jgi:hypothetical protein
MRFPVNPPELTIEAPTDHLETNVLGIGEIVIARPPGLRRVSWECFFPGSPGDPYVLAPGDFRKPYFYIEQIYGHMKKLAPLRFVVSRFSEDGKRIHDTNMRVLVESFSTTEKGGETGDFHYEIALVQSRSYAPSKVSVWGGAGGEGEGAGAAPAVAEAPQREAPPSQLVVGSRVSASGEIFAGPEAGARSSGRVSGLAARVARIDAGAAHPYYVEESGGGLLQQAGWADRGALQAESFGAGIIEVLG